MMSANAAMLGLLYHRAKVSSKSCALITRSVMATMARTPGSALTSARLPLLASACGGRSLLLARA